MFSEPTRYNWNTISYLFLYYLLTGMSLSSTPPSSTSQVSSIAAIVLPAGSGKSYMLKNMGLGLATVVEADDVCHPRETAILSEMRTDAKYTGEWANYDYYYGNIIKSRLKPNSIILLASSDLAEAMCITVLDVCVLSLREWRGNIVSRGEDPGKYKTNYDKEYLRRTREFDSNYELYEHVRGICDQWHADRKQT